MLFKVITVSAVFVLALTLTAVSYGSKLKAKNRPFPRGCKY